MVGFLRSLHGEKRVVAELRDTLRLRQSRLAPDLRRVTAISEALQALRQTPLLGFERRQLERRSMRDERNCRFAEIRNPSLHIAVRAAGEIAGAAATDAPDEGAILRIELLHAFVGLDHLRSADTHPSMLGNDDAAATGRDNAAATEGSRPTADERQNRDPGAAHIDDGANDLGDREFAGIRLLKPHAASVEQQQHSADAASSSPIARSPQQTHKLRAMHLAERAAQEASLLRSHKDLLAVETAAAHHDAIVEGACEIELREMRAHGPLLGPKELDEALRVEQPGDALAGGGLVPIRLVWLPQVAHAWVSISCTLCSSRKVTVSGRAPPSLIENRRPPGELRSKNSWITASHSPRKPVTAVATSTRHSWSGSTRSTRTSRLPEAFTPVMA